MLHKILGLVLILPLLSFLFAASVAAQQHISGIEALKAGIALVVMFEAFGLGIYLLLK